MYVKAKGSSFMNENTRDNRCSQNGDDVNCEIITKVMNSNLPETTKVNLVSEYVTDWITLDELEVLL